MPYKPSSGGSKKPKKRDGIDGFLANLVDDVQETATGLIPGLVHVGSSVVHDAGKAVGLAGGQYRTDDIVNAIRRSYTDKGTFWGELGRGNFNRAGDAFYANPLGPLLDGAALLTGGGAAVGKLAKVSGKDAPVSRVEMSPGIGFDRTLSMNPVIRGRQALFDRTSNRFVDAPLVGARSRLAKHDRRADARRSAHESAKNLRPLREALAGLHGVKRKAVWIAAGGHNVADLMKFYAVRHKALEDEIARKKAGPRREPEVTVNRVEEGRGLPDPRRDVARRDADTPAADRPRELDSPVVLSNSTDLILRPKMDVERRNALVLRDGETRAKRADTDEELAYEEAPFEGLLDADRRESLRVNQRNLAYIKKRIAELDQIQKKVDLDDPKIRAAAEAARKLTELTTKRLIKEGLTPELAARRASLEAQLLRTAGIRQDVYGGAIRSHVSLAPDKMDVSSGRGRSKWTKPGKLDELQKNTGYNFWNARDSTNPAMYIHSARQAFEYRARLDRVATVLTRATMVTADDAALMERRGWKVVQADSALRNDIDDIYKILVDAEEVFAGTPGYEQMRRAIEASLVNKGATDLVAVVPAPYYKELVGEFSKTSAFVRKWLDNPTRVWRALTLNLRPAWIVNNFVGQMLLLAVAHGTQGVKAYVEQFGHKGKVADKLAPELTDFGWAHESMADLAGLGGNKVTTGMRRMSDFMGNLNAKLTDDHTRKAAWVATMKPHIAAYRKAHPGTGYEDAAKALWKDERFADAVTQKVLDDMIDFSDLSNFERSVIKRAIPFYAWIKGISKRTARLVADDPHIAVAGVQAGQLGQEANRERYGDLPHFLQGIIDNPVSKDPSGVMVTQGLNPFMTPADIGAMISGTVLPGRQDGPQNPLAQLNPFLKAPAEALANRDFFYGREIDPKGEMSFGERVGRQGLNAIAQKRLVDEWLQQRQAERDGLEYDPLFEPSFRNALLSYFGAPVRTLDINQARRRALEE